MEILGIVLAILSFGATCFKAGYSLGRDIAKIHASLAGCDINVIRALEN